MRLAFLADIHANWEALTACMASARVHAASRIVFLGDIVGYGADPGRCIDIVQEECAKGALALRGNHDEAVATARSGLNPSAEAVIQWTRTTLTATQKQFLADLPMTIADDDRLYVHASARTPNAFPYITDTQGASDSLLETDARLTVCGHVHVPALYNLAVTGKVLGFKPDGGISIPLSSNRRWLAVMGAVGQPRDGNPAAAYGLLDTAANTMTFVRVPYDFEAAASKIRSAGLPENLWKRLSLGR